jgi:predicted patatin/cPLA2 family phospholipase
MPDPHPVLDLLARRARRPGGAGERADDGARLALVLEGGGMRGVVSAGMTAAIERLGLTRRFDLVVGTSAGALNGSALLAGVAGACATAYHSAFTTRRFINPYRLLIGRAAVDVAFTLDHADPDGLDADRHRRTASSAIPLHCVAVDVDRASVEVLSDLHSVDELRDALLASSRMPWLGGAPVRFRGRRYLDGGLAESIPYRTATGLGATHVLALQTRPWDVPLEPASGLADRIISWRLRKLNPALLDLYRRRPADYEAVVGELADATREPAAEPPFLYGLRLPEGTPPVSRLERDADTLRTAEATARQHAESVLSGAAGGGSTPPDEHPAPRR